jgi:hypothetical protein
MRRRLGAHALAERKVFSALTFWVQYFKKLDDRFGWV